MFIKRLLSWFKKDQTSLQCGDHKEPINRYSGIPLSEWMEDMPNGLKVDAVGLWEIIPVLRNSFGLYGEALIERTREVLLSLFARGAEPVIASQNMQGWRLETSYGNTPEEKAEAIIQEWLESGEDPIIWESVWFTMPNDISEFPEPGKVYSREKGYPGVRISLTAEQCQELLEGVEGKVLNIGPLSKGSSFLKIRPSTKVEDKKE